MTNEPHTCPYCELRFDYHNEVKDHILRDHRDHPDVAATVEIHEMPHVWPRDHISPWYERILVATDLRPRATAVTVASTLGATTRSLELLTVSPSRAFYDVVRVDLERIGAGHGWPPAA